MAEEQVMTIRTERTPNPNSLKYHVGVLLIPGGSANFPTQESAAERSPLAARLFQVDGLTSIFIGADFFTVTREDGFTWEELNQGIAPVLEEFFDSGDPVLVGKKPVDMPLLEDSDTDPALIEKIQQLLDEKVRPAVAQDGGDIVYRGFKEGVVYLEMHGACAGCPSSTVTLKEGVESMLKHFCEEVEEVRAI